MKNSIPVVVFFLICGISSAYAEEVVQEISWVQQGLEGRDPSLPTSETENGISIISISPENTDAGAVQLLNIGNPGVTATIWAIRGNIRYEGVSEDSFMEMWSYLGENEHYYSRTLQKHGPMATISGSSDWRPFVVPFFSNENAPTLSNLQLNIIYGGEGVISIGPLEIVQFAPGEDPLGGIGDAWWSARQAGLIGGLFGGLIGLLGALIGILTASGRFHSVVVNLLRLMIGVGLSALVLAIAAFLLKQPYAVWYPPAILGFIGTTIGFVLFPVVNRALQIREERRIKAMDS